MNPDKRSGKLNEIMWILTFFGTAIGAGILYLPIQAGMVSIWSLVFLSCLLFPLIYFSHKAIARLLLWEREAADYSGVINNHYSGFFSSLAVFVYFISFYSLLTLYSIGMNANLGEYLLERGITNSNLAQGPYLSLIILVFFAALNLIGPKIILYVMTVFSSLIILSLLSISIYLIPHWTFPDISHLPSLAGFVGGEFLLLPILSLSFIFFPPMSAMVKSYRDEKNENGDTEKRIYGILLKTSAILIVFVLFFVYSTIFSLSQEEFIYAMDKNISCLAALSHKSGISPLLADTGALIGIAALFTSFVGVFFAARDSAKQTVINTVEMGILKRFSFIKDHKKLDFFIAFVIICSIWIITMLNPSILKAFGFFIAPLMAVFTFILPVILTAKIKGVNFVKKNKAYIFVFAVGILMLFSYKLGLILKAYF